MGIAFTKEGYRREGFPSGGYLWIPFIFIVTTMFLSFLYIMDLLELDITISKHYMLSTIFIAKSIIIADFITSMGRLYRRYLSSYRRRIKLFEEEKSLRDLFVSSLTGYPGIILVILLSSILLLGILAISAIAYSFFMSLITSFMEYIMLFTILLYATIILSIYLKREYSIDILDLMHRVRSKLWIFNKTRLVILGLWIAFIAGLYMGFISLHMIFLIPSPWYLLTILLLSSIAATWIISIAYILLSKIEFRRIQKIIVYSMCITSFGIAGILESFVVLDSLKLILEIIKMLALINILYEINILIDETTTIILKKVIHPIFALSQESMYRGGQKTLSTPTIVSIEYFTGFKDKIEVANQIFNFLSDLIDKRSPTVVILTTPLASLQDYIANNLLLYDSLNVYVINISRSSRTSGSMQEVIPKRAYLVTTTLDPVHTPYVIERIKMHTKSSLMVIIDNIGSLTLMYGFNRVYDVLYNIVQKLDKKDLIIVLTPKDMIEKKVVSVVRNIAHVLVPL